MSSVTSPNKLNRAPSKKTTLAARKIGTHPKNGRRVKPHVVTGVRYSASPSAY